MVVEWRAQSPDPSPVEPTRTGCQVWNKEVTLDGLFLASSCHTVIAQFISLVCHSAVFTHRNYLVHLNVSIVTLGWIIQLCISWLYQLKVDQRAEWRVAPELCSKHSGHTGFCSSTPVKMPWGSVWGCCCWIGFIASVFSVLFSELKITKSVISVFVSH